MAGSPHHHDNYKHRKIPTTLKKPKPESKPRSDTLNVSTIPAGINTRVFYLMRDNLRTVPPPLISVSEFVPRVLISQLMRRKKNSALGVKFERHHHGHNIDEITNMEGALHTFITPVIGKCKISGDYRYSSGHGVSKFGFVVSEGGSPSQQYKLTRTVVMSASIQMDFETSDVMLRVCRLDKAEVRGVDLNREPKWHMLTAQEKQDDGRRGRYDDYLRKHMVYWLTRDGKLPSRSTVHDRMQYKDAIHFLEMLIASGADITERVVGRFVELESDHVVSLELLFNTALHQVRNEFSALEILCPSGYVYTYDPASIFAAEIGATLLNRLTIAALRCLSDSSHLPNMRIFAFNDYADKSAPSLLIKALSAQKHVQIARKADLFTGKDGMYDVRHHEKGIGAMLVIHNNSDAFGQNVETEGAFGSLDGAIGYNSSAAASLLRERADLLDNIL
jgi:hypothetical protein